MFCLEQLRVRTIVDTFVFSLRACFALSGSSRLSRRFHGAEFLETKGKWVTIEGKLVLVLVWKPYLK